MERKKTLATVIKLLPKNPIGFLSIVSGLVALVTLFIMLNEPLYLIVSLLTGLIAMIIDFFIEYNGISKKTWNYANNYLSFRNVPIEVPFLFFNCGILVTFAFYLFLTQPLIISTLNSMVHGVYCVQIALLLIGVFFMFQYFIGQVKSLVFWALPISIALYLSYPEPWMLVAALFPIYLDYYLEKRLVKSAQINYIHYNENVATNVAISYFPVTLFILGVVAVLLRLLNV